VSALALETSPARWLRVAKIALVFVVVGPLVASIVLFASHLIDGFSNARYAVSLASAPRMWLGWVVICYMAGAPYALIVGVAYALLAVFTRWSQWWVAILAGLAPLSVIHLLPPVGVPLWQMGRIFVVTAVAIVVIGSGICWALTRRWHGQAP
jgi:hypothetical protein